MKDLNTLQAVADRIEDEYSVEHNRMLKAIEIVKTGGLRLLPNGNWQVPSSDGPSHTYQCNLEHPRCGCMDYAKQSAKNPEHVCKHLASVLIWNALPDAKIVPQELRDLYLQIGLKIAA